jgi:outer membrane protein
MLRSCASSRLAALLGCFALLCACATAQSLPQASQPAPATAPAPVFTLNQAIAAAFANDPVFATARAATGSARLDAALGRDALLPNAAAHGDYLFTQPNGVRNQAGQTGSQQAPRFIANNAIREYAAQLIVNENLSLAGVAGYRRSRALAAQSVADLESARRDLVSRVVAAYFYVLATAGKVDVAQRALDEARAFVDLTQKLENGREVAHADVVKANLSAQQRQREFDDATLAAEKARLDLGVLLFPDPRAPYTLAETGPNPRTRSLIIPPSKPPPPATTPTYAAPSKLSAPHKAKSSPPAQATCPLSDSTTRTALTRRSSPSTDPIRSATSATPPPPPSISPSGIGSPPTTAFARASSAKKPRKPRFTTTQRQLIAQLDEYYHEARIASDQVASLRTSADTARESLRLTRLRYSSGEALALEVVDAQSSLAQAEAALADGILRSHVARANLQTLTGVL